MQDMINGVDRSALSATISAIQADPGLAGFRFRISNEWLGGGLNRSTVTDFHGTRQDIPHQTPFVLMNDEPPVLLSGDKGPNPVENLLHALSGCLTTSLVYHAAARGIRLAGVRTGLEGDLDLRGFLGLSQEVRRGYQGVRVVFEIDGVSARYTGQSTRFAFPVDSGASVANAVQARVSYDLDGDGVFDRVETYHYFATNDLPGWETYTHGQGLKSSSGALGDLVDGTVRLELWSALGRQASLVRTGAPEGQQAAVLTVPFRE